MNKGALVGLLMGSKSDYSVMEAASSVLRDFSVPTEERIISAHRTPDLLFEYAETAAERGLQVLIAGAGGSAHLPGMLAAKTILPVFGVPIPATQMVGIDALLSIVQMPRGVPVGTLAIGAAGAANAALLAIQVLSLSQPILREQLRSWRNERTREVLSQDLAS